MVTMPDVRSNSNPTKGGSWNCSASSKHGHQDRCSIRRLGLAPAIRLRSLFNQESRRYPAPESENGKTDRNDDCAGDRLVHLAILAHLASANLIPYELVDENEPQGKTGEPDDDSRSAASGSLQNVSGSAGEGVAATDEG